MAISILTLIILIFWLMILRIMTHKMTLLIMTPSIMIFCKMTFNIMILDT